MSKFIKEPLLHFLLIGAAFFLLYSWVGNESSSQNTIVINESDLDEIVSKFEVQWNRNPTEEELTAIVEKQIEEEIFYQEALKMNLDHNDEIIKRRLAQKMQFLSNDISSVVPPTEKELKNFYSNNSERYRKEAHYTLYHVFFSPDTRDDFRGDALKAVSRLKSVPLDQALSMGDEIAIPQVFENTSEFHITRQMGEEFAMAISNLPIGEWTGPIESGYGAHLVYIEEKVDEITVPFAEVQQKVLDDFNYENQKAVKESILNEFAKNYQVQFDVQSDVYSAQLISKMRDKVIGE